ncbi:MAG: DUF2247 family protein [Rhodothermales bacterium]
MQDLVKYKIPSTFVLSWGFPTEAELVYGYKNGWISESTVVKIALAKLEANLKTSDIEQKLALLLSDDLAVVDELLAQIDISMQQVSKLYKRWLFLALAWLWENKKSVQDPLEIVELLYADFEYPTEIKGFVRYMPSSSEKTGIRALNQRWEDYLKETGQEYLSFEKNEIV